MTRFFYKYRKGLAYFLYCLVVVISLLYVLFPSEAFKEYLESAAGDRNKRVALSINELRLAFPPGVLLTGTRLIFREDPEIPLLNAESIFVRPVWMSLFFGPTTVHFQADAYGGKLKGSVSLPKGHSQGLSVASLRAEHIQIQQYRFLSRLAKADLQGDFNGNIVFTGRFDQMIEGEGEAELYVSDGNVKLETPFLGVDSIDFGRLAATLYLAGRRIRVVQVDLKGNTLNGALSGTINLTRDVAESRLNLKGNVEPLEGFMGGDQGILQLFRRQNAGSAKRSFILQGTLRMPRFSFT